MDTCVGVVEEVGGATVFASTTELADFVWVREYEEWLARAHDDAVDAPVRVLVASDGCSPSVRDGEPAARTTALVNFDFPSSAAKYRCRMANVFAQDDDDDDKHSRSHGACVSKRQIVMNIITADDLQEFRALRDEIGIAAAGDLEDLFSAAAAGVGECDQSR